MKTPVLLAVAAWLLGACVAPVPAPQTPVDAVLKAWGRPTATYTLQPAGQRLEFASGPWGRTTWMIDLDATGRVTQARQVLDEAEFLRVQTQAPLPQDALLRWIGTPGERRGARGGGQTWSWRYPTNDCLWFQVSIDAEGLARSAAFAIDPTCDGPSDARE